MRSQPSLVSDMMYHFRLEHRDSYTMALVVPEVAARLAEDLAVAKRIAEAAYDGEPFDRKFAALRELGAVSEAILLPEYASQVAQSMDTIRREPGVSLDYEFVSAVTRIHEQVAVGLYIENGLDRAPKPYQLLARALHSPDRESGEIPDSATSRMILRTWLSRYSDEQIRSGIPHHDASILLGHESDRYLARLQIEATDRAREKSNSLFEFDQRLSATRELIGEYRSPGSPDTPAVQAAKQAFNDALAVRTFRQQYSEMLSAYAAATTTTEFAVDFRSAFVDRALEGHGQEHLHSSRAYSAQKPIGELGDPDARMRSFFEHYLPLWRAHSVVAAVSDPGESLVAPSRYAVVPDGIPSAYASLEGVPRHQPPDSFEEHALRSDLLVGRRAYDGSTVFQRTTEPERSLVYSGAVVSASKVATAIDDYKQTADYQGSLGRQEHDRFAAHDEHQGLDAKRLAEYQNSILFDATKALRSGEFAEYERDVVLSARMPLAARTHAEFLLANSAAVAERMTEVRDLATHLALPARTQPVSERSRSEVER